MNLVRMVTILGYHEKMKEELKGLRSSVGEYVAEVDETLKEGYLRLGKTIVPVDLSSRFLLTSHEVLLPSKTKPTPSLPTPPFHLTICITTGYPSGEESHPEHLTYLKPVTTPFYTCGSYVQPGFDPFLTPYSV